MTPIAPDKKAPFPIGYCVFLALGFWLVDASFLASSGMLARLPFPVPALVGILTLALLAMIWGIRPVRAWMTALDLRVLVGLHLTRFVGYWFLVLYGRGELPWAFAVPGGWGDIAVAATAALVLVSFMPVENEIRRNVVSAWNILGFVDILFVVGTAARLVITEPGSMAALTRLPMSLLPTYLVPIIIASHVLIFIRLRD